ncbi:MAG TPA: hypothetical protein VFG86_16785, partial [Chloroflexota bacterium]|nr:hypothetical protein [Chloroflexota bacterium]
EILERAFAHNLLDFVHTAQVVAPNLRAAAIPCGGGVAAFLGDDSPLTTVKGAVPALSACDIETAEEFFRSHGVRRAVFELAPWTTSDAFELLTRRDYEAVGTEDVVAQKPPFQYATPLHPVLSVSAAEWPALMLRVNEPSELPTWRSLVDICAVLPGVLRLAVRDEHGVSISCAQLVPAPDVAIFGNDATLESARGRGAQQATIRQRVRYASVLRFKLAAAEVASGSTSERNYLRCGFSVAYTRMHYARRLD